MEIQLHKHFDEIKFDEPVLSLSQFCEGKSQGIAISIHRCLAVNIKSFKMGRKHGPELTFFTDGNIKSKQYHDDGYIMGEFTENYQRDGQVHWLYCKESAGNRLHYFDEYGTPIRNRR